MVFVFFSNGLKKKNPNPLGMAFPHGADGCGLGAVAVPDPQVGSSGPTAASLGKSRIRQECSGRKGAGGDGPAVGGTRHASVRLGNFHCSASKRHGRSSCQERRCRCPRRSPPAFETFLVPSPCPLGKAASPGERLREPGQGRLEEPLPSPSSSFSPPPPFFSF